jgi:NADH:ubiquinone oxidoreductase subunit E
MEQTVDLDLMKLDTLIEEKYNNNPEALVMVLQEVSAEYNYLPEEALRYVAEKMDIPLSKVYSVATFYTAFHLEPRGRHIISQCVGTACHVRGAVKVKDKISSLLSIKAGETTEDMKYTLDSVRCLGCCGLGPVVKVDEDVYSNVDREQVERILEGYQ